MNAIDLDKSGSISYMEFISAAIDHRKHLTKDNIKKAFDLFDKDGDG